MTSGLWVREWKIARREGPGDEVAINLVFPAISLVFLPVSLIYWYFDFVLQNGTIEDVSRNESTCKLVCLTLCDNNLCTELNPINEFRSRRAMSVCDDRRRCRTTHRDRKPSRIPLKEFTRIFQKRKINK